ncbi:MAG: deoxyribose-phosphate aldolase, partial [Tissierellaceae bacterium]
MDIKSMIDHTILKPDTKKDEIQALCQEAKEFGFYAVCVNPYYVSLCKDLLEGSKVKIATVIGFPLGANTSDIKALETKKAIDDGADEIDMVINIGALKDGDYGVVRDDIK